MWGELQCPAGILVLNQPPDALRNGVIDVVEAGRMWCADYTDADTQNEYFDGYTQDMVYPTSNFLNHRRNNPCWS